jgi:hypothetical protein
MKKISYLLASAMSALAALAAGAATARTSHPELRTDQNAARESPSNADTIKVSQSAKDQIGTEAKPQVRVKGGVKTKPGKLDPGGPKSGAKVTFSENFKDKKGEGGPTFKDSFIDKSKPVTNPADRGKRLQKNKVQKTFEKNQK